MHYHVLIHLNFQLLLVLQQLLGFRCFGASQLLQTHYGPKDSFQVEPGQLFGLQAAHCFNEVIESGVAFRG